MNDVNKGDSAKARALGAIPVVPSRRGTNAPQPCTDYTYRHQHLIERCWSRLKEGRADATRHDKKTAACVCSQPRHRGIT